MTDTTVLILAAGEGTRWGNYRGVPKHLVPLCGERLLDRTVRLVREYAPDAAIQIVAADHRDRRYRADGASTVKARLNPDNGDADKFASSLHKWGPGRNVLLYGDVFFTDDAMAAILDPTPHPLGGRFFGRFDGSKITGAPGGECFAFVVEPDGRDAFVDALDRIIEARRDGSIWRNGGWELYRALGGAVSPAELLDHRDWGNATVIDDWTEDMDTARDWDEWCLRWAKAPRSERPAQVGAP